MKREEFDTSLSISKVNVGTLESMRKMLSISYEEMEVRIQALTKLAKDENASQEDKEKAISTIEQMYLIMFSMEYKATAIYARVKKAQEQLS